MTSDAVLTETLVPRRPWYQASFRTWLFRFGILFTLTILALLVAFILHLLLPRNYVGNGEPIPLELSSGPFQTLYYSDGDDPKGIVVLATGSGGWSYWEEKTAKHLLSQGYVIAGWDCRKFADSRKYDQKKLAEGFTAAAEAARERSAAGDAPVWYGGWSTGAEQSVAAAAADEQPENLVGLLLAAPGSRGRFGIFTSDLLGISPTGEGSYALADMAKEIEGIKVAQFEAGLDPVDDVTWLKSLKVPSKVYELKTSLHDMGGLDQSFRNTSIRRWPGL